MLQVAQVALNISDILLKPKAHYRMYKSTPLDPMKLFSILTSHFVQLRRSILAQSSRFPQ
jgi:hypothetical protein